MRFYVQNELGLWCINDRRSGRRAAIAFSRRLARRIAAMLNAA